MEKEARYGYLAEVLISRRNFSKIEQKLNAAGPVSKHTS